MSGIRDFAHALRRRLHRERATAPTTHSRGPVATRPAPEPQVAESSWPDLPKSDMKSGRVVELPDSAAEPGGPPVRVDPTMVSPATAERMRPVRRIDQA